ncbi:MAG: glycosyltransferase [Pedosphaera sp.]|nr:glycosyltransferase [Pedosphaera sp.]
MPSEPCKNPAREIIPAQVESIGFPLVEPARDEPAWADPAYLVAPAGAGSLENTLAPTVEIVVPVYNQLAYTRQCLESLRQNTDARARIIIIDNGSTDGTAEFLGTRLQITVLSNPQNLGCAAAWNQGVRAGAADWVAILNNDILLTPGWLDGLLAAAAEYGLDIVSPAVREGPLNYEIGAYGLEFVRTMGRAIRRGVAHGICFLTRRSVFETIGLFDENFRIGQFEDADFFQRACRAGFRLGTTGRSFIHHFGSVTQDSIRRPDTSPQYESLNRAYYRQKWRLAWHRRYLQRVQTKARLIWWSVREHRHYRHSLNERWRHGKLFYD